MWQELYCLSEEDLDHLYTSLSGEDCCHPQLTYNSTEQFTKEVNQCNESPADLAAAVKYLVSTHDRASQMSVSDDPARRNALNLIRHAVLVIQDYLIAATGKDCSLFITMQVGKESKNSSAFDRYIDTAHNSLESGYEKISTIEGKPQGRQSNNNCSFMLSSDKCFSYKIWVVDLDFKDIEKIPKHFQLSEELDEMYESAQLEPTQC